MQVSAPATFEIFDLHEEMKFDISEEDDLCDSCSVASTMSGDDSDEAMSTRSSSADSWDELSEWWATEEEACGSRRRSETTIIETDSAGLLTKRTSIRMEDGARSRKTTEFSDSDFLDAPTATESGKPEQGARSRLTTASAFSDVSECDSSGEEAVGPEEVEESVVSLDYWTRVWGNLMQNCV